MYIVSNVDKLPCTLWDSMPEMEHTVHESLSTPAIMYMTVLTNQYFLLPDDDVHIQYFNTQSIKYKVCKTHNRDGRRMSS